MLKKVFFLPNMLKLCKPPAPPPRPPTLVLYKGGGIEFSKIFEKMEGSDFSLR